MEAGSSAGFRVATAADASGIANTLALAFHNDPLWGLAFPDPAQRYRQLEAWWRFFLDAALRYPWTWTTRDYGAATVWIPPGGTELSAEAEDQVEPLLSRLLDGHPQRVLEIVKALEHAHPTDRPHFYLSLFGTHPDHRGRGIGMALLADNLKHIDAQHRAAYLESSNPGNDARYESVGFAHVGRVSLPGGLSVATMWRDPR
jgi:GNAT superfamily N-acetyltransferase